MNDAVKQRTRIVKALMGTPRSFSSLGSNRTQSCDESCSQTSTTSSYKQRQLMRTFLAHEGMGSDELDKARESGLYLRMKNMEKRPRRRDGWGARGALMHKPSRPPSARLASATAYIRRRPLTGTGFATFHDAAYVKSHGYMHHQGDTPRDAEHLLQQIRQHFRNRHRESSHGIQDIRRWLRFEAQAHAQTRTSKRGVDVHSEGNVEAHEAHSINLEGLRRAIARLDIEHCRGAVEILFRRIQARAQAARRSRRPIAPLGFILCNDVEHAIYGSMSDSRMRMVRRAFRELDGNGNGFITAGELAQRMKVSKHPAVLAGTKTQKQVLRHTMRVFDVTGDGVISRAEWEHHFGELSSGIPYDADFEQLVDSMVGTSAAVKSAACRLGNGELDTSRTRSSAEAPAWISSADAAVEEQRAALNAHAPSRPCQGRILYDTTQVMVPLRVRAGEGHKSMPPGSRW